MRLSLGRGRVGAWLAVLCVAGCAPTQTAPVVAPVVAPAVAEAAPVWQAAPVPRVTVRRYSTAPTAGMPASNVAANTGAWLVRR